MPSIPCLYLQGTLGALGLFVLSQWFTRRRIRRGSLGREVPSLRSSPTAREVTRELSILGVTRCAGMPDVLWESPEPAAVDFSYLFERNNPHLPPSVTELFLGEPVRCTSFFDEGCRCGSVRENVLYE